MTKFDEIFSRRLENFKNIILENYKLGISDPILKGAILRETTATINEIINAETLLAQPLINGKTELSFHCFMGSYRTVIKLIKLGFNVNAKDTDGCTPLMSAAAGNHNNSKGYSAKIVELLLNNGADINALNCLGQSALHLASNHNIATILTLRGADVNLKDNEGQTPLDLAEKNNYKFVQTFLMRAGAKRGCDI